MRASSQRPTCRQSCSFLHFLHLDVPVDVLKVKQSCLGRPSGHTDVSATRCQDPMDVLQHGLYLGLSVAFLVADYAVKCTFINNTEEGLLHDLGWLCDIHLSV